MNKEKDRVYQTIIIGAGIAGCTAAIYASRKRMDFLLISEKFGGQFLESGKILNYPGIVKTNGEEFNSTFKEQLKFNDVEPKIGEKITEIKKIDEGFLIKGDQEYKAKTVIVATGSKPKKIGVEGEDKFKNKGLTYCSICDGPLFSDKTIAIIGGGNSALEAVEFTKDIAKKIYLINIDKEFNAHEYLIEKVNSYQNVEVITKAKTTAIYGDKFVEGIKYEKDSKTRDLKLEGVIIEIGRSANTGFVEGFLKLDEKKHIEIDCQSKTSVEGVFAAGDCASGLEYQYVIAAGQGCIALLKASRYLANKK